MKEQTQEDYHDVRDEMVFDDEEPYDCPIHGIQEGPDCLRC